MKRCPHCHTEYSDQINFCTKDGRALVAKTEARSRLCPHCANSIAEDAARCPYCKAELGARTMPEWPEREDDEPFESEWPEAEDDSFEARWTRERAGVSTLSKIVLAAGIVLCALGLFLLESKLPDWGQPGAPDGADVAKLKELEQTRLNDLEQKEKVIAQQEQQIQQLEARLAQARQPASEAGEVGTLKAKLEKTQKELTTTQQRLGVVSRELDESSKQRAALREKLEETQRELSTSQQRLNIAIRELNRLEATRSQSNRVSAQTPADPAPSTAPSRSAEPGTYETVRVTTVHEQPSSGSRVIAQLGKGTRLSVVRSVGGWLEVRSRHGKPPGYVRVDDAMYVSSAN